MIFSSNMSFLSFLFQSGDDYLHSLSLRYAQELSIDVDVVMAELAGLRNSGGGRHSPNLSGSSPHSSLYASVTHPGQQHTYANLGERGYRPGTYAVS